MIKLDFAEPDDAAWLEWRTECDKARIEQVSRVEAGNKAQITALYKDQRVAHFYKSADPPFHGKCAYCECDVLVNQPGDIEHWRPKNRVTDEDNHPIQIAVGDGATVPHPGYYWLAYACENLLLACEDCNRPSSAKTRGVRIGKWDQFPVRDFRASTEGMESMEEPLLINPLHEDPSDHLEIDETGAIVAKTDRGELCIRLFGLNSREALVNARRDRIKHTKNSLRLAAMAAAGRDEAQLLELLPQLESIKNGAASYSAAGRVALRQGKEELERFVGNL